MTKKRQKKKRLQPIVLNLTNVSIIKQILMCKFCEYFDCIRKSTLISITQIYGPVSAIQLFLQLYIYCIPSCLPTLNKKQMNKQMNTFPCQQVLYVLFGVVAAQRHSQNELAFRVWFYGYFCSIKFSLRFYQPLKLDDLGFIFEYLAWKGYIPK